MRKAATMMGWFVKLKTPLTMAKMANLRVLDMMIQSQQNISKTSVQI